MTKTGGDLHSYPVPTCSAVTGLTKAFTETVHQSGNRCGLGS
ncbi:MAG: hypothetical protein ACLTBV_31540 [Enterocloster bolteae]